ncbi:hypothetical protein ABIB68_007044 [Bradyrhizobium sp. F1.2.2]
MPASCPAIDTVPALRRSELPPGDYPEFACDIPRVLKRELTIKGAMRREQSSPRTEGLHLLAGQTNQPDYLIIFEQRHKQARSITCVLHRDQKIITMVAVNCCEVADVGGQPACGHPIRKARGLLDELRAQIALKYLRTTRLSNDDTALALGFSGATNSAARSIAGRTRRQATSGRNRPFGDPSGSLNLPLRRPAWPSAPCRRSSTRTGSTPARSSSVSRQC